MKTPRRGKDNSISTVLLVYFMVCSFGLVGQSPVSVGQLYNKGNAEYESGNYSEAVYYYERANILEPGNVDIETNLLLATEKLDSDIIVLEPFFLSSWWRSLAGIMSPGGWKIFSMLILVGLVMILYLLLFRRAREYYSTLTISGIALLSLLLVSVGCGVTRQAQIYDSPFGILANGASSLLIAPDPISEGVKDVGGGVKVEVLDESGAYYKVSTMDKEQGWIEKDLVRRLLFSKS